MFVRLPWASRETVMLIDDQCSHTEMSFGEEVEFRDESELPWGHIDASPSVKKVDHR